jgi:hypothetical protein
MSLYDENLTGDGASPLFITLEEYHARVADEVDWILHGFIALGSSTMVGGKPKAGKSTWLSAAVAAIVAGEPFLGRATRTVPVWYASEEGGAPLKRKLPKTGDMRILARDMRKTRPSWPELLAAVEREAPAPGLLIIDTYRRWASREGSESDPAIIREIMGGLDPLLNAGWAVVVVHHSRKMEGDHGDTLSGNNDLVGAVDIISEVRRVEGARTQRVVLSESRFTEETPGALLGEYNVETRTYGFVAEGDELQDVLVESVGGRLLETIERAPGLNQSELVDRLKGSAGRDNVIEALHALQRRGDIVSQKHGNAHLHYLTGQAPEPELDNEA